MYDYLYINVCFHCRHFINLLESPNSTLVLALALYGDLPVNFFDWNFRNVLKNVSPTTPPNFIAIRGLLVFTYSSQHPRTQRLCSYFRGMRGNNYFNFLQKIRLPVLPGNIMRIFWPGKIPKCGVNCEPRIDSSKSYGFHRVFVAFLLW